MLDWGYEAALGGGVALQGKAAASIEGEGRRQARYIVLRHLKSDLKGRTFVARTLDSLILPSQVDSVDDLAPGTWVIAEVDGSIGIKVGAQYGFSVDWVREASLGGLRGDVGLKIKAGIDVALGFSAAGRFLVAVSRPSLSAKDKTVRVQIFKMRRKGWDFALNAGATVKPQAPPLPETFDGLLSAVFGIDGAQLFEDLRGIRSLADPAKALKTLLGDSESVQGFISQLVPGVGSVIERYGEAWKRIDGLLKQWDKLDHGAQAFLSSKLGDAASIQEIRAFLEQLKGLDSTALKQEILEQIEGSAQGDDVVLQWLSSVADGDLLSALTRSLGKISRVADETLKLLDPESLGPVLDAVHGYLGEQLQVDRIREAIAAADPDRLDPWLDKKLKDFLGEAGGRLRLEKVARVIELLEAKSKTFYDAARTALERKYEASFALAYKRSTERTALADLEIDGAAEAAGALLKQAISGDLGRLLLVNHDAVKLRTGTLTHGIERQTSVSISLPFFDRDIETFTKSLAKVAVSDEPGGRVVYSLDAENIVERNNKTRSRLALSGTLKLASNKVRVWSEPEWLSTYEYSEKLKDATRAQLAHRLEPLIQTFFADDFPMRADGSTAPFSTWLDDWDRTITRIAGTASDSFGNTGLLLSVAIPPIVAAAWALAPGRADDPGYLAMSLAMQRVMRMVMLRVADSDPKFYKKRVEASSLLVYASLPPAHDPSKARNGPLDLRGPNGLHWSVRNQELLERLVNHPETTMTLGGVMARAHNRLGRGGMIPNNNVAWWEPKLERMKEVMALALTFSGFQTSQLNDLQRLLSVERVAIRAAQKAGQAMAEFRRRARADAAEATAALARFGEKTTEAFNEQLGDKFGNGLPTLSAELFSAAARAFDPSIADEKSLAILEILSMREGAAFPKNLRKLAGSADVILAQRFVRG